MRGWRNRQTRWIQVPVPERAWGFNSPLAHQREPQFIWGFSVFQKGCVTNRVTNPLVTFRVTNDT